MVQDSGQAKITQLGILVGIKEDVAWFQISVQNALRSGLVIRLISCHVLGLLLLLAAVYRSCLGAAMAVIEARDDLCENLPDEVLLDVLFRVQRALNDLLKVATFAVLHDNVNF